MTKPTTLTAALDNLTAARAAWNAAGKACGQIIRLRRRGQATEAQEDRAWELVDSTWAEVARAKREYAAVCAGSDRAAA